MSWDEWGKIKVFLFLLVYFVVNKGSVRYNLMHDILKISCDEMSEVFKDGWFPVGFFVESHLWGLQPHAQYPQDVMWWDEWCKRYPEFLVQFPHVTVLQVRAHASNWYVCVCVCVYNDIVHVIGLVLNYVCNWSTMCTHNELFMFFLHTQVECKMIMEHVWNEIENIDHGKN